MEGGGDRVNLGLSWLAHLPSVSEVQLSYRAEYFPLDFKNLSGWRPSFPIELGDSLSTGALISIRIRDSLRLVTEPPSSEIPSIPSF